MAFIKLFPPEGSEALPVPEIIRRLRDGFASVDANPDEGREHVDGVIAATLRFSDELPHKQQQLVSLRAVRDSAVYVTFGDSEDVVASCCLMPDHELFFGSPDEVDGPARPLVQRCAAALGYELFEG
jgi:hypothetical protein